MTSENTATVLRNGLELLREYGWIRNFRGSRDWGYCALGAIEDASRDLSLSSSDQTDAFYEAREALAHAVDMWFDASEVSTAQHPVVVYNDYFAESVADIEMIFTEALHRV